ncbi:MAG: YgiT-type zinc finger protein [Candidatus Hydrothermarchaeales archaeon]
MKTCYHCGGKVEKRLVEVKISDVVVSNVYADVCKRCGEKYFDTKTATFIQKVTSFVNTKKKEYMLEVTKGVSTETGSQ